MTQKQEHNVPDLRFPEFGGEWEEKHLGTCVDLISGQHLSPDEYSKDAGETPYFTGPSDFTNDTDQLTKWTTGNSKNAHAGDVLVTVKGSGVGELWHLRLPKVAMGRQLMAIKGNTTRSDLVFQFLSTQRNYLTALAAGNMIPGLTRDDLLKIKVGLPTDSNEQKKIASFLSSVDRKIEQLGREKQLLQQYKKGTMQKLFSQELRFKDNEGNNFPDWEEKRLGGVLEIKLREQPKPRNNYLAIGVRSHMKGTFQKPNFDPQKIAMEKLFVVRENDLIVNITFAWEGAIAIVKAEDDGGFVSHRFPTYNSISEKLLPEYIKQVILNKRFKHLLDLISPGGAGRNRVLSKKSFLKLEWLFPPLPEQRKIANYLSSLDQKIDLIATELEHARTFKKGLLQQMFV